MNRYITLQTPHGSLHGQLEKPEFPRGLILIARSHHLPVDGVISARLVAQGYAVFAMELLTTHELQFADATQNVPRLAQRMIDILDMIRCDGDMQDLPLGIFTSGDIAPAAIRTAAQRDAQVKAVVCHGGLIDRAGAQALDLIIAPLLMLFDVADTVGETAYQRATSHLRCIHQKQMLEIGDDPTMHAVVWFSRSLTP
jgi:hypothetical protein